MDSQSRTRSSKDGTIEVNYTMTSPCPECPFLKKNLKSYGMRRLKGYASGEFPCHKTAECYEDDEVSVFRATKDSLHCAGALIFLEKRDAPHQMMRICERLGMYDRTKLDMKASVT
jgi:hypothetical protein